MEKKAILLGVASGLLVGIIWGLWPVLTRYGVGDNAGGNFSPTEIMILRSVFSGIILLPYYIQSRCYQRVGIVQSLIISGGAGAFYVYIAAEALRYVPAGHLGIVGASTMLCTSALVGFFILGEGKARIQILGYAIVVLGLSLIGWQSFVGVGGENALLGDLLLIGAGILWAIYTIFTRKWKLAPWDAVAAVSVYSLLFWAPLMFLVIGDVHLSEKSWGSIVSQGIGQGWMAAVAALWFYSYAVAKLGAARGALFGALVPAFSVLGGFILLSEAPTELEIMGVLCTSIGMLIALNLRKI